MVKKIAWVAWLILLVSLVSPAQAVDIFELSKLSLYQANGEKYVVLAIAATEGKSTEVADRVRQQGGRVDYVHSDIDYVAAVLPGERIQAFLDSAPIEAVAIDNYYLRYDEQLYGWKMPPWQPGARKAEETSEVKPISAVREPHQHWPPPLQAPNLEHAYDILQDMDGMAFRERHPDNDGRGVVIAHVEWFPDFLLPELQTALDASGRKIPKFLDVINIPAVAPTFDPETGIAGAYWTARLSAPIISVTSQVTYQDKTYIVPRNGTYRLSRLALSPDDFMMPSFYELASKFWPADAEPASKAEAASGIVISYPVLWSDELGKAWLDTDLDGDFSDESAAAEYRATHVFGIFGKDDPATPARDTLGYALQKEGDFLSFNFGLLGHTSMVAGAAAANRSPSGRIDGVAPGAQLLAIGGISNSSIATFCRGLITAFMHPQVDVVLIEGNVPTSGVYFLQKDGRSVPATVLSRLQKRYAKPAFATADNVPGMTRVADMAVSDGVIAVGAYQSADSVYANLGLHTRYRDNLHWVGAEGPAGNGALKPDLLSPATPISLEVGYHWEPYYGRRNGIFQFPPGYAICGGTSCATPVAAGAAALLIGAAKREHLPINAANLHRALRESARHLPRFDVYQQGRGLLQIDAAWRQLQAMAGAEVETIEVSAPIRSVTSRHLMVPNTGPGLFEREGWQPGMRDVREITLLRTTGPDRPMNYALSWQGEQGAFQTRNHMALPLNTPVKLPIRITVDTPRVYSAVLRLQRDGVAGSVATVPVTIVVPHQFTAENDYEVTDVFQLDRPGRRNLFFDVPEGTEVFRVTAGSERSKIMLWLHAPNNYENVERARIEDMDGLGGLSIVKPMPGVWQVTVEDNFDQREHDWSVPHGEVLPSSSVTVTASIHAVDVRLEAERASLRNRFAAFTSGGMAGTPLAAWRERGLTLRTGERLEQTIDVAVGTERLVVGTELETDDDTEVDLYLYDCSDEKRCVTARRIDVNGRNKQIVVEFPNPGRWKVAMMARGSGQASFRYREAMVHPSFGALSSSDIVAERKPGESWQTDWEVWQHEPPPQGYELAAVFSVGMPGVRIRRQNFDSPAKGFEAAALLRIVPLRLLSLRNRSHPISQRFNDSGAKRTHDNIDNRVTPAVDF